MERILKSSRQLNGVIGSVIVVGAIPDLSRTPLDRLGFSTDLLRVIWAGHLGHDHVCSEFRWYGGLKSRGLAVRVWSLT